MDRDSVRNQIVRFREKLAAIADQWESWLIETHRLYLQGAFHSVANEQKEGEAIQERLRLAFRERSDLLQGIREEGVSVADLCESLRVVGGSEEEIRRMQALSMRVRGLRQHSLALWILAFQCVEHTSQVLQILSTGEAYESTYGGRETESMGGGRLVDQAA